MKYAELGYNSFLIRTILIPSTQSPAEARNAIPTGSLGASQFSMPMNPTTTIVFSSTDYNTAAWAAGVIYFANSTQSLTITAGNTGDITATTYIYYSEDKSPVLQTTTTPLVATGSGKFLLAIVELGVSGKDCKITPTIAAGLVVSGLTADQIKTGTIVVGNIDSDLYKEINLNLPSDENLVGYWTFDEATGTTANDSSGNGHTGTLTNMIAGDWVAGISGVCLDFDGTDAFVTVPDHADFTMAAGFALICWTKTTDSAYGGFVSNSDGTEYFRLDLNSDHKAHFATRVDGGAVVDINSNSAINDGEWHHLAAVRTAGGLLTMYVDGILQDSTDTDVGEINSTNAVVFGRYRSHVTGNELDGIIDEVRIYNAALTAEEVYALYKNPAGTRAPSTESTRRLTAWQHGSDVTKIDGGDVYTNTITATQIAAGTVTATEITGTQLDAVATNTGTLNVDEYINVGESNVKIDGANKRILINDGTDDRILIGFQQNGF